MSKIRILVGPEKRKKRVEAVPIAAGLSAHPSPGYSGDDNRVNITHTRSGLAVLSLLKDTALPQALVVLTKKNWDVPAVDIAKDPSYYYAVVGALEMRTTRDKSNDQEARVADDLGGRTQPASGARWGYRRDVITPEFLIEAKTTEKRKYSVSFKDLGYLYVQASMQGKTPTYVVELEDFAEIAVVPAEILDPDDPAVGALLFRVVENKTFPVSVKEVNAVRDGKYLGVTSTGKPQDKWVIMSYDSFLTLAKG